MTAADLGIDLCRFLELLPILRVLQSILIKGKGGARLDKAKAVFHGVAHFRAHQKTLPRGHLVAVSLEVSDLGLVREDETRVHQVIGETMLQLGEIEIGVRGFRGAGIDGLEKIGRRIKLTVG